MNLFSNPSVILVALLALMSACNNGPTGGKSETLTEPPAPPPPATPQNLPTLETGTVQKILAVCLDCHSSGQQSPDLSTPVQIKRNINRIQAQVIPNLMPPVVQGYQPLSNCQKDILRNWANSGMPDSSSVEVRSIPSCANVTTVEAFDNLSD